MSAIRRSVRSHFPFRLALLDHGQSAASNPFVGVERLEDRTLMSADTATLWAAADGGNDHLYEAVQIDAGLSWDEANAQAQAMGGTLVTITSQAENDFVFNLINDSNLWFQVPGLSVQSNGPWIGAFRPDDAPAGLPLDQGWEWVTGEVFSFENFASNEPNRITERFLHFAGRGEVIADTWANALNVDSQRPVLGFVVEYEQAPPPPNEAPTFVGEFTGDATAGVLFEMVIEASDPEGDLLTFSEVSMPFWLSMTDNGDGTATLSGTASFVDVGANAVVLSVTDGEHVVEQIITINVAEPEPDPDSDPDAEEDQASVSGVMYQDANFNGVQDEGEAGLEGWIMFADEDGDGTRDEGEAFAITDADGNYTIEGLDAGDYDIHAAAPVDESVLEDFQFRYKERRTRVVADVNDADHFRKTQLDDRTFLYEFESGDDALFDEFAMRVEHGADGKVTITMLEKARRSRVSLLNADGRFLKCSMRPGRDVLLTSGFFHTSNRGMQSVTVGEGQDINDTDFGVVHPLPDLGDQSVRYRTWNRFVRVFTRWLNRWGLSQ